MVDISYKTFKEQFNVPGIKDNNDVWCQYFNNLKENSLTNNIKVTPQNTDSSQRISKNLYWIVGTLIFAVSTFTMGWIAGFISFVISLLLVFLGILCFNVVNFIIIPFKNYKSNIIEAYNKEIQEKRLEEMAIKSGDVNAIFNNLVKHCKSMPINMETRTKLNKLFDNIRELLKMSETNSYLEQEASKYVKLYLSEIINDIEKNIEINNNGAEELYQRYIVEINKVIDRMSEVVIETIEQATIHSGLPIEASLKAVSQMLEGEKREGNFQ